MHHDVFILASHSRQNNQLWKNISRQEQQVDWLFFEEVSELPHHENLSVYSMLILLPTKLTSALVTYIKNLERNNIGQSIHIIAKQIRDSFFSEFGQSQHFYLWELSSAANAQLDYIIGHSRTYHATLSGWKKQEDAYQRIIRHTPLALLILNGKGQIIDINDAFLEHFNYEKNEILGYSINKVIPDLSPEQIKDTLSLKEDLTFYLSDYTFLDKAGRIIPCEGKIFCQPYNQKYAYILYISDISEQQTLKRSLEKRNDLFLTFSYVINILSHSLELNFNNAKLLDLFKKVFMCDFIYIHQITRNPLSGTYEITAHSSDPVEGKLIKKFEDTIYSNLENLDLLVYHPDHLETLTAERSLKVKTLITLPLHIDDSVYGVMNLFYLNEIEPEPFVTSFIKLMGKVLALSEIKTMLKSDLAQFPPNSRMIIENALDGIYQTTPDGKFIYANPALVSMLGFESLDELKQISIDKDLYLDPSARDAFKKQIEKYGKVQNFVTQLRTRKQETITVLEHAHIVKLQNGRSFYEGFIRDITEFRELEEQLRTSQNFTDELIDQANFIILALDKDQKIITWNRKAEMLAEYSRSEMIGRPIYSSTFFEDPAAFDKTQTYLLNDETKPVELNILTKSGTQRIINWTGGTLHSLSHGECEVWFGVDVTHSRKLEERLFEAKKMETLNSILSNITENFNLLLAEIQSEIQFYKSSSGDTNLAANTMGRIEKSLAEGMRLRNQILAITRKSERHLKLLNPNAVIDEVITIIEQTRPSNVSVKLDLKNHDIVELDSAQFNQVMVNLALNAFEAMTEGGELTIQTNSVKSEQDRFLKNLSDLSTRYVRITVSDTGHGISEDNQKRIFEPFFTTKQDAPVRGLGLTYSYQVMKDHKGFLFFESREHIGTSFHIFLPVIKRDKEETRRTIISKGPSTILVIDDEVIIRELLSDILKSNGYHVLLAEDGQSGVELYKENRDQIDLVILDIVMPGMDGKQVYEQIKSLEPEVRVLITSGYSKSRIREELLQRGVDGFLPKPFDIEALLRQLENILQ